MKAEKSCGAVVYTVENGCIKYLIVRSKEGIYGFPKGHIKDDESEMDTVLREIKEETGLSVNLIDGFGKEESYSFVYNGKTVNKSVVYYLAAYSDQYPVTGKGKSGICSVDYQRAMTLLQHDSRKRILYEVDAFIKSNLIATHYDLLISEGNDPVLDPPKLKEYMDKWDGELFIDLLELDKAKSVLEIGCGTGRLALRVADKAGSYCGIDISSETIGRARVNLNRDNVLFICGNFLSWDFNRRYDIIYSSLTFMHIEDKRGAIKKIYHLLVDDGIVVLSIDKNKCDILDYGSRKIKIYPDDPDNLIMLMEKIGLCNIEIHETEFAYIVKAKHLV